MPRKVSAHERYPAREEGWTEPGRKGGSVSSTRHGSAHLMLTTSLGGRPSLGS